MPADAAHPNPEVARRLQHIYTLHRTDIDLRLGQSPYIKLLEKIGNPQNKLPPVVHVAGTNGKGSTIAFLRAMLEAAGYKVHAYTSPHLITFNERIYLAGKPISDEALCEYYDRIEAANNGASITFFEFTTAMAFLAMAETPADIVLLEVGMGGRLDCTNVIEKPACTVITKISYDHMDFLGDTLQKIAGEKAGIMKAGIPCVIAPQMDENAVLPVFKNAAKNLNTDLIIIGPDSPDKLPEGYPVPSLIGSHQLENAATALAVLNVLERHCEPQAKQSRPFIVPDEARKYGLGHTHWPARMQRITEGPIAALLPDGAELWFDAAHNDSGAQALANQLKAWKTEKPDRPIHLIVGLAADKDVNAFFRPLNGLYDTLTLVDLPDARRPQTAEKLAAKLGTNSSIRIGKTVESYLNTEGYKNNASIICIAGSLYLYHHTQENN